MSTGSEKKTSSQGKPPVRDTKKIERARIDLVRFVVGKIGNALIRESRSMRGGLPGFLAWDDTGLAKVLDAYLPYRQRAETLMVASARKAGGAATKVIDRHKVAGAFILAILDAQPLVRNKTRKVALLEIEEYANEILAFKVGVAIVAAFARAEGRLTNKNEMTRAWCQRVYFPSARNTGDYRRHAYRMLRCDSTSLNIPALANWMFMLERFHERSVELSRFQPVGHA